MIVNKITTGFVVQKFDTARKMWVSQQFIAGNPVDYENDRGETVDPSIMGDPEPYLPFDMEQPH